VTITLSNPVDGLFASMTETIQEQAPAYYTYSANSSTNWALNAEQSGGSAPVTPVAPSVNLANLESSVATAASVVADGPVGPVSCSPEGNGSTTYLCLFNDGGPNSVVVTVFANGSWTSSAGVQGPAGDSINAQGTPISNIPISG
jgi:hypothetical protein